MSDLGGLSECLVDNDPAARVRARRLRSKALALSIALEAAILAAMLVWPLIAPGVLTAHYIVTPAPPFRGGGARPADANPSKSTRRPPTGISVHLRFPTISARQPQADTAEAPDLDFSGAGGGSGEPGLPGLEPSLAGGTGDRVIIPEPPHAEPPHVRPMPRSEGVMAAMLLNRVEPKYPAFAIVAHISGNGNPLLAQAARAAVANWRYHPTMLNGEPVEVETYVTVNFVLN